MTLVQHTCHSNTLDPLDENCFMPDLNLEDCQCGICQKFDDVPALHDLYRDYEYEEKENVSLPAFDNSLQDGWWTDRTDLILPLDWKHIPKQTVILDGPLYCFGWEEDLTRILGSQ